MIAANLERPAKSGALRAAANSIDASDLVAGGRLAKVDSEPVEPGFAAEYM